MAHQLQDVYSKLVDEKLRASLVTRDNFIFNTKHEGEAKGGKVRIPVRSTEVAVGDYNKATGGDIAEGTTTYIDLILNKDKYVNEVIDGYDAQAVPDGIVAERLDSAAYSLAETMDKDSIRCLEEEGTGATASGEITEDTVYKTFVELRKELSNNKVPTQNRWAIVSPDVYSLLLLDSHFIKQSDLSQELVMAGAVGRVAGFAVFESTNMAESTEVIVGHPNWCHRVKAWEVPVKINNLTNEFIGASAVQGRAVYGVKVSNPKAVLVKSK